MEKGDNVKQPEKTPEEVIKETVEEIRSEDQNGVREEEPKKKSRKGLFAGISVSLVVLIATVAAVVTIVMQQKNEEPNGSTVVVDDEEEVGEQEMDVQLVAGTVTTTIGGQTLTYNAAYVVDGVEATVSAGEYASTNDNEVVFLVMNGGKLTIDGNVAINKSGSTDFQGRGDNYSFYGLNSAIVVVGEGSSVNINGARINTDVSGANAVVATNGGEVTISNSKITTSKDNSRGLHATYAGTINADNVSIATKGGSCASLATDRGEGTIVAKKMTLNTEGAGSPLIYSTGSITVSIANGVAKGAQIAVVEGKNSITLSDCDFSASGNGNRNEVDNAGIMIYQSMSGDAGEGTGTFTAEDCSFAILADSSVYYTTPMFFVTNTVAMIKLTDVKADFYEDGYFLLAKGTEEWGKSGKNGGIVTLETSGLEATNASIGVDEISSVESF